MPFTDFQKHCTECQPGQSCGKHHVYVLELRDSVAKTKKFLDENPHYQPGMPCLYVGRTSHIPKCRADQHRCCRPREWENCSYTCYCKSESPLKKPCSKFNKGSKTVAGHNTYKLKAKLFRRCNPQENEDASKEKEERLAEDLRKQGYAVWSK